MLAHSFLIESSSKLLVTRTGIKAQSSLNLGRIRPLILELLALEWRKFHTFELEYLWSQLANLDQILCVASLGWGKGCIRFWARLTWAHWTQVSDRCPLGYLFNFKLHTKLHILGSLTWLHYLQDIITTQEEFGKMASEFVKFRRETQAEIQRLKVNYMLLIEAKHDKTNKWRMPREDSE